MGRGDSIGGLGAGGVSLLSSALHLFSPAAFDALDPAASICTPSGCTVVAPLIYISAAAAMLRGRNRGLRLSLTLVVS
jgi:hypothetical protein